LLLAQGARRFDCAIRVKESISLKREDMTDIRKREALKAAGKQRLARYGMEQFLREVSTKCAPGSLVLDAGTGNCKHLQLFPHVRTVAMDNKPTRYQGQGVDVPGEIDLPIRSTRLPP
jgi:hypothetical protein